MRTNIGADLQSDAMGAMAATDTGTGATVTYAATTVTDTSKAWATNAWAGRLVVSGAVYGVVVSNTATVLTIDRWYAPATPGGAAGTTPSANATYSIAPGNAPASYLAITENSTAPAGGDTALTGELTAGGLGRKLGTYAHTAGATSYTLTTTYTSSDGTTRTVAKYGQFHALSGGRMPFTSLISPTATVANGDQLTVTATISLV
jgi:hypothetical protein